MPTKGVWGPVVRGSTTFSPDGSHGDFCMVCDRWSRRRTVRRPMPRRRSRPVSRAPRTGPTSASSLPTATPRSRSSAAPRTSPSSPAHLGLQDLDAAFEFARVFSELSSRSCTAARRSRRPRAMCTLARRRTLACSTASAPRPSPSAAACAPLARSRPVYGALPACAHS